MGVLNKTYNCIFVRVPRTGTGSLGSILNIGGGHMPIIDIKKEFEKAPNTPKKWEEIFKFGFCRNPYTRFVSAYYNLHNDEKQGDINEFIKNKEKMDILWKEERVLFTPVNEYLCDEEGNIAVDYVGRFEDLHNCWNYLFEKLKVPVNTGGRMIHVNRTDRYKVPLNDKSKEILYNIYKKDFEIFEYE